MLRGFIDKKGLRSVVPFTPQHIQRLENEGKFPPRIPIGLNRVSWDVEEVQMWLDDRKLERDRRLPVHTLHSWKSRRQPDARSEDEELRVPEVDFSR